MRTYSRTFWKRYRELGDDQGEKYIKQIERGEQRIQRQQDIMDAIAAKMDRYRNPWQVYSLFVLWAKTIKKKKQNLGVVELKSLYNSTKKGAGLLAYPEGCWHKFTVMLRP